ncbi:hypothetical protein PSAB6_250227 [Paraburkholderia sabiae]|nr:hypothetical protein PSAB6_250227 [Paraburkholderia sabiae]
MMRIAWVFASNALLCEAPFRTAILNTSFDNFYAVLRQ